MKKEPTANEIYARLVQEVSGSAIQKVPAGFKTSEQWAREAGKSGSRMRAVLGRAVKKGLAERARYWIRISNGRVVPVNHFRLKK